MQKTYGNDLRLVVKHNPLAFHNRAMAAALAAEAAGRQGKFWKMHDKLFTNNKNLTDENFVKWAKNIGLNVKKFKRDLKDPELKARIEAMQVQGVNLGARGTPAFFVNGRFLSGAQPVPAFEKLIDEELAAAKKLVNSGVPRAKVYEMTIADGRLSP